MASTPLHLALGNLGDPREDVRGVPTPKQTGYDSGMDVFIVGAGKLAGELLEQAPKFGGLHVRPWGERDSGLSRSVVVHAGSGRELPAVWAFCAETSSPLLELATGSTFNSVPSFPVVICANTNILMLKFMIMLRSSGHLFRDSRISVTESHQATKNSVPGTALHIAQSLGVSASEVESIRDADYQRSVLGVSAASLARHALHEVVIESDGCTVRLQSRVDGPAPYVKGVASIARVVSEQSLENRFYDVTEMIGMGWL